MVVTPPADTPATQGPVAALTEALIRGDVEVVDLTQPLGEATPVIELPPHLMPIPPVKIHAGPRYDGVPDAWNWLELAEHVGTHVDAPIHWVTGREGLDMASVPAHRLVGPAVVLDRSAEAAADPEYLLTVDDLVDAQRVLGPFPDGGWLLVRTGWDERATDRDRFLNGGVTPGFDAGCAEWLAYESPLAGVGVQTVGIDAGRAHSFDPPFPMHHHLLAAGKLGLTQLAALDRLPATGALLVVAPLRIVGGTGSPARVLALVPTGKESV